MGIYFNPDNEGFKKCSQGRIYMHKSMLIKEMNIVLNDTQNCVAISHARRFGKTQAAVMLKAYYSKGCDSRELFSKFEQAFYPCVYHNTSFAFRQYAYYEIISIYFSV